MMRIRVMSWDDEIIGSVDRPAHDCDKLVVGDLQTCYDTRAWWIDNENRPLGRVDAECALSTRVEFFLTIDLAFATALPGWERLPPSRIIDLSVF